MKSEKKWVHRQMPDKGLVSRTYKELQPNDKNISHHYEGLESEPTMDFFLFIHSTKVFATNSLALLEANYVSHLN